MRSRFFPLFAFAGAAAVIFAVVGAPPPARAAPSPGPAVRPPPPPPEAAVASMQDTAGRHLCGAALVRPRWVVTAAHCIAFQRPGDLRFRIGSTNRTKGGTVARAVQIVPFSPDDPGHDLALVRLRGAVSYRPYPIGPAVGAGTRLLLLGWGQTCDDEDCLERYPIRVKKLMATAAGDGRCASTDNPTLPYRPGTEMCLERVPGRGVECHGDSGGPALVLRGGAWLLVGVTSRGTVNRCGDGKMIFTNLEKYRVWIDQVTGQWAQVLRPRPGVATARRPGRSRAGVVRSSATTTARPSLPRRPVVVAPALTPAGVAGF